MFFAVVHRLQSQGQDWLLFHSQNMTVAARAMAERKTFGHLP